MKTKAKIKKQQKLKAKKKNILKKPVQKTGKKQFAAQAQMKQPVTPAKPPFLLALAQVNVLAGDIQGNAKKITAIIEKVRESGTQLVLFPELSLTGPAKDLFQRPDFVDMNLQKFIEVVNACKGISCIFGFVNKGNKVLYNAAAVVKDQKILGIHHKNHLGCSLFDENKYFSEGTTGDIFFVGNTRIGLVLCTELLEVTSSIDVLVQKGVDLVIVLSASPYSIDKPQEREQQLTTLAKKYQMPFVYCNTVGGHDELLFDGNSFVADKTGLVISRAKAFSEDLLLVNPFAVGKSFTPAKDQAAEVSQAITLGLRDYFAKTGHSKAVLGISGGLDSAVTATLAAHSLGKENVVGLVLPSKITSKDSLQDAKKVCANLGIECKVLGIDNLVLPTAKMLGLAYDKKNISLTEQNIQARVRAQLLMNFANKNNALVLASCNKTDLAIGYCTLYGETAGAVAPLADLWKTQVKTLAVYLNAAHKQKQKGNIIPESILKKEPSAELRPGQKDKDDVPQYDILDKILQLYVVHKKDIHEIAKMGFDIELVRRIAFMVVRNEFKRQQMPMPLRISSCSFGKTWQYPVVSGWRG